MLGSPLVQLFLLQLEATAGQTSNSDVSTLYTPDTRGTVPDLPLELSFRVGEVSRLLRGGLPAVRQIRLTRELLVDLVPHPIEDTNIAHGQYER